MKIRYNFELKSKTDSTFEPWLQTIFNCVEDNGVNDFTLRVVKEKIGRNIYYHIHNKKNKTYATITKRRKIIKVEVFKRLLPCSSIYIKPPFQMTQSFECFNTPEGKEEIAKNILLDLDAINEYSESTVEKIKVCSHANVGTFVGGRIMEICYDNRGKVNVIIDNGLTFNINGEQAQTKGALVNKYIVLNEHMNFDIVEYSEFGHYFELV